ncbi:MAG TPA: hypothetical protein VNE58_00725 [Casimicrobiaceae bacterium]|nr:hypothetical protein [Casimicrobiaceae bacterium]
MKIEEIHPDHIDSGGNTVSIANLLGKAMPREHALPTTDTERYFQAVANFVRTFDFKPDDRLVFLADRLLDPRVVSAITGLALAQGVKATVVTTPTTNMMEIPAEVKPILEQATFVVSTWFCSVFHPYCIDLRRNKGQRWVKITFFRNLDLLHTAQARFPTEIVGALIRATAARIPRGIDYELKFTDRRGSDLTIPLTAKMTDGNLNTNRWRGELTVTSPGAYVHYLPTHGPNLYEPGPMLDDPTAHDTVPVAGTIYPQWAVGFEKPFRERIGVRFDGNRIVEVSGASEEAAVLRDMLIGGVLIELGVGFNPKWPRHQIYPAGSNAPGALHFGVDLKEPSSYIRKKMPNWEEPPVHMDLVTFDSTVDAGSSRLISDGFLEALRDRHVVAMAARYGDAVDLLENWPD